ncbi:MAG: hypothetical protein WC882_01145 [Candidatus Gracilibacteria bacterium]
MKKFLSAIFLLVVFTGCSQQDMTLEDKIENFSNYTTITDANVKSFVPTCDEYSEAFAQKVMDGDVARLYLYTGGDYALQVYMTPNYDNWTEADFDKVNQCGELGTVLVKKVVADSLLWSYPYCSAGVKPNTNEPGYEQFMECTAVEEQLLEYFNN